MVSPAARAKPKNVATSRPRQPYGTETLNAVCQGDAPSAALASRSARGTRERASSDSSSTVGAIITANKKAAAARPSPVTGASSPFRAWATFSKTGTRYTSASQPYTTLGTADAISRTRRYPLRTDSEANSVSQTAARTAGAAPIAIAPSALVKVPTMSARAPNDPASGFHVSLANSDVTPTSLRPRIPVRARNPSIAIVVPSTNQPHATR